MTETSLPPEQGETWTVAECAAAWGVKPGTWTKYVSSGRAPKSLLGYDEQRRRRWDAEEVRSWPRPGRGARTDLRRDTPPQGDGA